MKIWLPRQPNSIGVMTMTPKEKRLNVRSHHARRLSERLENHKKANAERFENPRGKTDKTHSNKTRLGLIQERRFDKTKRETSSTPKPESLSPEPEVKHVSINEFISKPLSTYEPQQVTYRTRCKPSVESSTVRSRLVLVLRRSYQNLRVMWANLMHT